MSGSFSMFDGPHFGESSRLGYEMFRGPQVNQGTFNASSSQPATDSSNVADLLRDIPAFGNISSVSTQVKAEIANDRTLSKREARILTADMERAIKNEDKKLDRKCSSNDATSNIDKVTNEMQKAADKLQKFANQKLDPVKCLKQRNSLAIACGPILAAAIAIAALAFIFAAPLAFIIAGAILLGTGLALGISSLARHIQYQSQINSAAKLAACSMQMIKQASRQLAP